MDQETQEPGPGRNPSRELLEEIAEYQKIVLDEIGEHRRLSRIAILTGAALLIAGLLIANLSVLGWLLAIVGIIRILNSAFDLQRKDRLREKLRLIEQRFGRTPAKEARAD